VQDRCILYVFRCAVYFAETPANEQNSEKLKWWNWKDQKLPPVPGPTGASDNERLGKRKA